MVSATPIPDRFPARTSDIAVYQMCSASVPLIQLVIDLDGALDGARLRRALRLLLDAEPTLGCRFEERWWRPVWQRLDPTALEEGPPLDERRVGDAASRKAETQRFLARPLRADEGPQLAALWLRGRSGDRLVLKVHHLVADAGGVKELAYRLTAIYRALAADPDHTPPPRLGTRSLRQVYGPLVPWRLFALLRRLLHDLWVSTVPPSHLVLPMGHDAEGPPSFQALHLAPGRVARLADNGVGATLNDVFCAAFLRALARVADRDRRTPLRLWGTVDLRRYLPDRRADALCNLSGFFYLRLGAQLGERYEETLARVRRTTAAVKASLPGLAHPLFAFLLIAPMPLRANDWLLPPVYHHLLHRRGMPPVLTNMGPIDADQLVFGGPAVTHAHLVVPTSLPAGFIAGMSGFRGGLTITVGHFASALPGEALARLLGAIDEELPG